MDFNKTTQEAINKIISDKLPGMVEEKATKMVEDIVSDIFRWGNVKNQIKTKIEESINVNLQRIDLIDYNALIAKTINENLVQQVNLQPILSMTQSILGFVDKKEIKLQEIANIFIESSMDENDTDGEGEITFIVIKHEKYNWIEVFADVEQNKDRSDCDIKFIFSTSKYQDQDGLIFSLKRQGYGSPFKEMSPSELVGMGYLEHKIFRLHSAQVKITDYDKEIDTYWSRD